MVLGCQCFVVVCLIFKSAFGFAHCSFCPLLSNKVLRKISCLKEPASLPLMICRSRTHVKRQDLSFVSHDMGYVYLVTSDCAIRFREFRTISFLCLWLCWGHMGWGKPSSLIPCSTGLLLMSPPEEGSSCFLLWPILQDCSKGQKIEATGPLKASTYIYDSCASAIALLKEATGSRFPRGSTAPPSWWDEVHRSTAIFM